MRFIVNIFIEIDKPLKEFDIYLKNISFWEEWAKAHSYKHILITKENYRQFINECHFKFIDKLKFEWNKIDFIKYCALEYLGNKAIYIDLDMTPLKNPYAFFEKDYLIIGSWWNDKKLQYEICNNLIKLPQNLSTRLIEYSKKEYNNKINMEVYNIRKIRFMLQTTGTDMFKRFMKMIKLTPNTNIYDYFDNGETKCWLMNFK